MFVIAPILCMTANGWLVVVRKGVVMVSKEKCAFLRNGECLLHHGPCSCNPLTLRCADGVRRAKSFHGMRNRNWVKEYDLRTENGRFRFNTRAVSGGEVYSQCKSKKRYPTEYRAREIARRRERSGGINLRVYPCHFCGGYHLTSHIDNCGENVAA